MTTEGLPIVAELRAALERLVDGDPFSWQQIGGSYDLLRHGLVEAVRGSHGLDAGPPLEEIWSLLGRPEALEQVTRFHRLDPHYAGVAVDSAWLHRNARGLVATARTALAAQRQDVDALATWSGIAGELLGHRSEVPPSGLAAPPPAGTPELVDAAFRALTEVGWRVQGPRLWTLAWLPRDETPSRPSRRRGRGRRGPAPLPVGPAVRVPVAGCFDGKGFLAVLCLHRLEGDGELLPHPETALQPLGAQLLGSLRAAWAPFGQSVCFTFGVHDANIPSWVPLEGSSLSGAAAVGFELLRQGQGGEAGRLVMAQVGSEGALEAVGHEVEKMGAALSGGVRSVVLASDSQVPEVCVERFRQSGLEVLRARTLREVLDLAPVPQDSGGRSRWKLAAAGLAAVVLLASGFQLVDDDGQRCPSTSEVEIVAAAVWSDNERDAFQEVLQEFCRRTGIRVRYNKSEADMAGYLRLKACAPPDVVMVAQPGLLEELVSSGRAVPLQAEVVANLDQNYSESAKAVGTVNGKRYGVFFKATNKSLWLYNVRTFKKAGVNPPRDWQEVVEAAETIVGRSEIPWFTFGAKDGWPLTDLFENIYLRVAGPAMYEELAKGRLPWTHASVVKALTLLDELLDRLAGDGTDARSRSWRDAALEVVGRGPTAATTVSADFALGHAIDEGATPETDFDFFDFPSIEGSPSSVITGGDIGVVLTDRPEAQKLLAFLATPEAAAVWARRPGFATPNRNVDPSVYPDTLSRRSAERLTSADWLGFDLSDQQRPSFGAKAEQGMIGELQRFLVDRDPEATAKALKQGFDQAEAVHPPPATTDCG